MFDNKPFEEIEKQAKHVIDLLNQEGARKKAIALKPFVPAEPLPQTASKFGGRPYLPAGELPPTNEKGEPLGMIAQINCAELPENDIYPATGLLQFWINPNDEECLWGFDYETRSRRRITALSTTRRWVSRTRMPRSRTWTGTKAVGPLVVSTVRAARLKLSTA